jgi:hypothetical protein
MGTNFRSRVKALPEFKINKLNGESEIQRAMLILSYIGQSYQWSENNPQLVILTVKEIREQIAIDINATSNLWKAKGLNKSRKTQKAFDISAAIARGQHERQSN